MTSTKDNTLLENFRTPKDFLAVGAKELGNTMTRETLLGAAVTDIVSVCVRAMVFQQLFVTTPPS